MFEVQYRVFGFAFDCGFGASVIYLLFVAYFFVGSSYSFHLYEVVIWGDKWLECLVYQPGVLADLGSIPSDPTTKNPCFRQELGLVSESARAIANEA